MVLIIPQADATIDQDALEPSDSSAGPSGSFLALAGLQPFALASAFASSADTLQPRSQPSSAPLEQHLFAEQQDLASAENASSYT